jgi:CBS domain-containing protein
MQVEAILRSKGTTVYTVPTNASVADAVGMLNRYNIGAVIVVDAEGEVAGIISERDIVRLLGRDPTGALKRPVSECMTTNVITVGRDTTVAALMEQMTRFRIRHIPIVEQGVLVGIVSIGDVVKRKIQEAEEEALALREYIAT